MSVRARDVGVTVEGATLVSDVSFDVQSGQWLAIIGPNGAGKSTVLKAVAGVMRHTGTVEVDGLTVRRLRPRERARLLAYAPQVPTLPAGMRVVDYVLLGRTPHLGYLGREGRVDREIVTGVLTRLDLAGFADRHLSSLSGGELQRVVLARALAQQASVLLLDEPTTALDIGHQQQVLELVDRLRRDDGLTVVTSLHDLSLAGQYADRLLLLAEGRVAAEGTPAEVLTERVIARHYGATVAVSCDDEGRPIIRTVRPGGQGAASHPARRPHEEATPTALG